MDHVYSQKFYRFPAFNLAIVRLTKPWTFNSMVNKIPFATQDSDFDGMCTATAVKASKSWSKVKYLYTEEVEMLTRSECEKLLCRSCRLFMCSLFDNRIRYSYSETEGGGLICFETGDPAEVDPDQGVLVAVTTIINIGLPNLHMKVGMFNKWVTDISCNVCANKFVMITGTIFVLIKYFRE
uniref:Peptidase S1 domain-containing protein n=1 Tax=Heliothis virescens TaxID=7102 RepID=A0A2A4JGW1_HELVI